MGYGFFQDEHGDRSSSRLMAFIALVTLLICLVKIVWATNAMPEIYWGWLALPIAIYFTGKVGQPAADFFMKAFVARFTGVELKPEEKPTEAKP